VVRVDVLVKQVESTRCNILLHLFGHHTVVESLGALCVSRDGGVVAVCVCVEYMVFCADWRHQAWVFSQGFIEISEDGNGLVICNELLNCAIEIVDVLLSRLGVGDVCQPQESVLL
jgi:hypothetical protein